MENFKVEFASLRRSVRRDEYARVSSASPPATLPRKVGTTLAALPFENQHRLTSDLVVHAFAWQAVLAQNHRLG